MNEQQCGSLVGFQTTIDRLCTEETREMWHLTYSILLRLWICWRWDTEYYPTCRITAKYSKTTIKTLYETLIDDWGLCDLMQVRADWSLSLQHHPGDKPPEGRQQQGVEVSGNHQRKHQGSVSRLHFQLFIWRCSHCCDSFSWRQLSRPPAHQPHHALCGSAHHGHHRELHKEERPEEGQNICSGHRAPGS